MNIRKRLALACCLAAAAGLSTAALAETPFPLMPSLAMDPDGTLHFKDRTVPMPTFMSAEAKARYLEILKRDLTARQMNMGAAQQEGAGAPRGVTGLDEALKVYPSETQDGEIAGVKVVTFTPKDIPARNKNRVVLALNSNAIGAIVANVGKMKVITPLFSGAPGSGANAEIVKVYRDLLKTHKPSQIAFVGISGGCQLAANTTVWLRDQKLPFPGALGLMTCAGGSSPGDSRETLEGLDPNLSGYTPFAAATRGNARGARPTVQPGQPPREILDVAVIPKGFPPSYLLSGTRDLCLSETVVLHRRLKNAGVPVELNIWEGMWHGFNFEPALPETREAARDLVAFLDKHLAI